MEQKQTAEPNKDEAKRETEEIAEAVKTLPRNKLAFLHGIIVGMQTAEVQKAG